MKKHSHLINNEIVLLLFVEVMVLLYLSAAFDTIDHDKSILYSCKNW